RHLPRLPRWTAVALHRRLRDRRHAAPTRRAATTARPCRWCLPAVPGFPYGLARSPSDRLRSITVAYQYLITSVEDGVGIIQLNHPEKRNALGWELHHEIIDALQAWAYDDAVAAVLFVGNEEYFCSGWALDVLAGTEGTDRTSFNDLAYRLMI